jgi:hypothetical protein
MRTIKNNVADDSILAELQRRWSSIGSMRCGIISAARFHDRTTDPRPITTLADLFARWSKLPVNVHREIKRLLDAAPQLERTRENAGPRERR